MTDLLTTRQAALLLGVGATAIKRWADRGDLPCIRTAGGHRRFQRAELERFLNRSSESSGGDSGWDGTRVWLDALLSQEESFEVEGMLLVERGRLGSWYRVADRVGEVISEIGRRWERGELSIREEHYVSEKLNRVLARISHSIGVAPDAPRALLVVPPGEEHSLGLSLVEICFLEAGWQPRWCGPQTPTEEILASVEQQEVDLISVSASAACTEADVLAAWLQKVGPACRDRQIPLLLGGGGAWPQQPLYGIRLRDCEQLHLFLSGMDS